MLPAGLKGKALLAAQEFADAFPDAVFTSGKRSLAEQARAMSTNVAINRAFIAQTYRPSKASQLAHAAVIKHTEAKTASAITAVILSALNGLPDDELGKLSLHLSGEAFDVKPVKGVRGGEMAAFLHELAARHGGQFLEWEAGLRRWHWQHRGP